MSESQQLELIPGITKPTPLNLKGGNDRLLYFRRVAAEQELRHRMVNGQLQQYKAKRNNVLYFDEEQIRSFTLELGPSLPGDGKRYVNVDRYLLDWWSHILGPVTTLTFIQLLKHAYHDKDISFPSLDTIAWVCGVERRAITSSIKTLEQYGFVCMFYVKNLDKEGKEEAPLFKVRKTVPFLTQEMLDELPEDKQREHQKFVDSLSQSHTIFLADTLDFSEKVSEIEKQGNFTVTKPKRNHQVSLEILQGHDEVAATVIPSVQSATERHELDAVWSEILALMKASLSPASFETWYAGAKCYLDTSPGQEQLFIELQSGLSVQWVRTRHAAQIRAMFEAYGWTIPIQYRCSNSNE